MEKKKISIIVPAYNIEDYLGRCLDSLLAQSYQNLEIIVVDDGSADRTAEILDAYAIKDSRIIAVHQQNQGVSAARNHGLDLATGDYIGFTDGDDLVEPDMFAFLANLLDKKKVDIAHCGYQMVFPNRIDYYYNTGIERLMNNDEGVYELLTGTMIEPGLWNKLYRAELFQTVRLPVGVQETEDLLCNFELFMLAKNSYFADVPKYHYMLREGSATTSVMSEKKYRDRFYVASTILERCKGNDALYGAAYEKYIRIIIQNATQQNWSKLRQEFRQRLKSEAGSVLREKNISRKLKGMVLGVAYMPGLYRLVRGIYEKKTGINHKYDLQGK
ncbi:glycosyltransferase family 2 protein [Frisingicoccus sp.]|uniref:glycosyltransferase family 2 protein n=1 Tax=Frisingicoccus sp. TaxID=1918627 RepID=UPI0025C6E43A|nr:glycosyltransferase family 2 protein [Frisingicoccus sp.]